MFFDLIFTTGDLENPTVEFTNHSRTKLRRLSRRWRRCQDVPTPRYARHIFRLHIRDQRPRKHRNRIFECILTLIEKIVLKITFKWAVPIPRCIGELSNHRIRDFCGFLDAYQFFEIWMHFWMHFCPATMQVGRMSLRC